MDVEGLQLVMGGVVAWVLGKARRAAGLADGQVDHAMDVLAERAHGAIDARLGADPAWVKLNAEAETEGAVSDRTRQRVELAVEDAVEADPGFAEQWQHIVAELAAKQTARNVSATSGGTAVGRDLHIEGGQVAAQTMRQVNIHPSPPGPHQA